MAAPIVSIKKADLNLEQGNLAGICKNIAIIRADALASEPDLPDDTSLCTGDFTFKDSATEVFASIYHTRDTGEIRWETQGSFDNRSLKVFAEFYVPTLHTEVTTLVRKLLNENVVVVGQDKQGKIFQVGRIGCEQATIEELTGSTGKAATDNRGATFVISADMVSMRELPNFPQTELGAGSTP